MQKTKSGKNLIWLPITLLFNIVLLTVSMSASAYALTKWQGTGQIIRGPGQGKTVELVLEEGDRLCISKGPSQGNCIDKDGKTPDGRVWKVRKSTESMRVVLYTLDDQVVDFTLYP